MGLRKYSKTTYYEDNREVCLKREKEKYKRLKSEHRCVACGIQLEEDYKFVRCSGCIRKYKKPRTELENVINRAKGRERYRIRKEAGICVDCGKVAAAPGITRCRSCGDKANAYYRYWTKKGALK